MGMLNDGEKKLGTAFFLSYQTEQIHQTERPWEELTSMSKFPDLLI